MIADIAGNTGVAGAFVVLYSTELASKLFSELLEGVVRRRRDPSIRPTLFGLPFTVNSMTAFDRIVSENAAGWGKSFEPAPAIVALEDMLQKLFFDARDEIFEDGMGSFFSAGLIRIVRDHGVAAVRALERIISAVDVNAEVAEEALRQMGHMDDKRTYRRRLFLLERALESPNARIRDAASIGIEAMDDPAAIESLQRAIDSERHEQLRQNFKDVLTQLQDGG